MPRYIDADKIRVIFMPTRKTNYSKGWNDALKAVVESAEAETAEVVPVIHAHWIKDKGYMLSRCSACQNTIPLGREYKHKYCPNCGAKMDLEEHDA